MEKIAVSHGTLVGLQVGRVRQMVMPEDVRLDYRHRNWTSGIFKSTVAGRVEVLPEGIAGDQQADLENHGGPDNVVLAYDADHYPEWRERLGMPNLAYGSFGENFTVAGFSDHTVCIGDIWEVGDRPDCLRLQITQARQPCYKLARRLQQPHIVKMVHENQWGGWYLRVLQAGEAAAGMAIRLVERLYPKWTVGRAVAAMYGRKVDTETAHALATLPELSARWKRELVKG